MQGNNSNLNDPQSSNSFFSTGVVPILQPLKSKKKSYYNIKPLKQRVQEIDHKIVTQICIISSTRLRGVEFVQQLSTFRYQTVRKLFGQQDKRIQLNQHLLIMSLNSLFNSFKTKLSNRFYILLSNNAGVLYFSHKSQCSYLLISCRSETFKGKLQKENIKFDFLPREEHQREKLLIRNRNISIFWGYYVNYLLEYDSTLQIVSNFDFMNSNHIIPHQIFNGKQTRQEFQQIAATNIDIIGRANKQLYNLTIQGYWMQGNIQNLIKKLNKQNIAFDLSFKLHPYTQSFCNENLNNDSHSESQSEH